MNGNVGQRLLGVVIDTQNLIGSAIHLGFTEIDYRRVLRDVVQDCQWEGVACVSRPLTGASIDGFGRYLERLGLQVAVWDSPVAGGRRKVDLDALFVREAMRMIFTLPLDELWGVAGDADYHVLAEACSWRGLHFGVAGFSVGLARTLRDAADTVVELGVRHLGGAPARAWQEQP